MKSILKNNYIAPLIILLTLAFALLAGEYWYDSYTMYENENVSYERGRVTAILSEETEYDAELEIYLGRQTLLIQMLDGNDEGEQIEVTNYLTATHNVHAKVGTYVVINADRPDGIEAYYSVYNYDRTMPILCCVIVLVTAIIGVGGGKGMRTAVSLVYSMFVILCILLPATFSGYSPIALSIACAILISAVTLLLLNGQSAKTLAATVATTAGVLCSLVFFLAASRMLHINGFSSSDAEGLILIGQATGLKIRDVLFASVLISSLGAITDTAMSIVSSLYEIRLHRPDVTARELYRSGMEIGKDMIGTMTNTLILAFTGGAFVTLLVHAAYGADTLQLLNSNYIAIEIASGVCGAFGVVLTVPITSAVASISIKVMR